MKEGKTYIDHEIRTLQKCVNYCWHRIKKHPQCGLLGLKAGRPIDIESVLRWRQRLDLPIKKSEAKKLKLRI